MLGPLIWWSEMTSDPRPKAVTLDTVRMDKHRVAYRLADARYAYVVCDARFDYRLYYPGRTISLWTNFRDPMHHLNQEQIAERLGQIDAHLMQLGVRIDRAAATGEAHDEAATCVGRLSRSWTPAGQNTLHHLVFGE